MVVLSAVQTVGHAWGQGPGASTANEYVVAGIEIGISGCLFNLSLVLRLIHCECTFSGFLLRICNIAPLNCKLRREPFPFRNQGTSLCEYY